MPDNDDDTDDDDDDDGTMTERTSGENGKDVPSTTDAIINPRRGSRREIAIHFSSMRRPRENFRGSKYISSLSFSLSLSLSLSLSRTRIQPLGCKPVRVWVNRRALVQKIYRQRGIILRVNFRR